MTAKIEATSYQVGRVSVTRVKQYRTAHGEDYDISWMLTWDGPEPDLDWRRRHDILDEALYAATEINQALHKYEYTLAAAKKEFEQTVREVSRPTYTEAHKMDDPERGLEDMERDQETKGSVE